MMINEAPLTKKRKQELFNICANHLIKQAKHSVQMKENAVGMLVLYCQYRGPNGLQCAAGPLIPSSKYNPSMEGGSIRAIQNQIGISDHEAAFVFEIQVIHDSGTSTTPKAFEATRADLVRLWPGALRTLAEKHGLIMVDVPSDWAPKD